MNAPARRPAPEASTLDQYLFDISRYPLIDREEEVRLAQDGSPESLEKLVRSNLRFVVSVAKKYQNRGVPLPDLINEGNVGLIRAADRFDPTKGVKFISYAVWWIRQAILQALAEQSRVVRVPMNRAGALHRVGKYASNFVQERGREPTAAEIARELDLSSSEVEATLSVALSHRSLDAPVGTGDDSPLAEYLPDDVASPPDDDAYEEALRDTLCNALSTLTAREAKVVRLYFGLDGQEPMTLNEIGELLGLTRERVRQIKEKALERLSHPSRARFLRPFTE